MPSTHDAERFLTAVEIAKVFRVSRGTVWRWGRDGVIPRVVIGSTIRYDSRAVEQLLNGEAA